MYKFEAKQWHYLSATDVLGLLEADLRQGLGAAEVRRRQQQFGGNVLTQKKGQHPLILFLLQFNQPLVYILLGATLITAALQEWVDSGVIFATRYFAYTDPVIPPPGLACDEGLILRQLCRAAKRPLAGSRPLHG